MITGDDNSTSDTGTRYKVQIFWLQVQKKKKKELEEFLMNSVLVSEQYSFRQQNERNEVGDDLYYCSTRTTNSAIQESMSQKNQTKNLLI